MNLPTNDHAAAYNVLVPLLDDVPIELVSTLAERMVNALDAAGLLLTDERCGNCDHPASFHSEGGCWFTLTYASVGANLVCPCLAEPGLTPPEAAG